jgi:signal transduction histidine kinase
MTTALPLAHTRLAGPQLWLARLAWLVVVGLALALLSQMLRVNYGATYGEWVLQQASPAVRSLMRYSAFVRYVIFLEWLGAGISLAVAFLIAQKRSHDWLALLISASLVLMALLHISSNTEQWRFPGPLAFLNEAAGIFVALCLLGLFLLFFLFPDGRFVPRWSPWLLLLAVFAMAGLWALKTTEDAAWFGLLLVISALVIIGLSSQIYRYRRTADPVQRQQTKWVVFGFSGIFVWLFWGVLGIWRGSAWGYVVQIHLNWLAFALIPATMGVSILRYRLWDIDILINRTLVYGALALAVLLAYGLIVGGLAFIFQTQVEPFLAFLATTLIALLALPLHQRLRRGVNRLMYGDRDDPLSILSRLGQSLEAAAAPDEILPTLAQTVAQSLRLPFVAVESNQNEVLAQFGAAVDAPIILPLSHQNEPVGRLIVAPRAPGETFTPAEHRLLADIARQTGAAIHARHLTTELRRSRQMIVTGREEERRRLRRDLHDGLGPQLATLALKLDAARNLLPTDPAQAERLLIDLKAQTQAAIADIRRLAYDLRPPSLDQLGLVPALREHAARGSANGLMITIAAPSDLPMLPAAVEVAAYRIITEAVTNTIHHAQARTCAIRLCFEADALYLAVDDDGAGLADGYRPGVGFASMRERAEEMGGACRIERRTEGGTRVSARLPLP